MTTNTTISDELALRLVRGGHSVAREIMEEIAKPPPKKLLIDTDARGADGAELQLLFQLIKLNKWFGAVNHDGATQEDVEKCRRFPQKRQVAEGWLVPVTEPNVAHFTEAWSPDDYTLTPGAQMLLEYHTTLWRNAGVKLGERAEFLASGVIPDLADYVFADNDRPPHAAQRVAFSSARTAEFFSLTMDMGTGKSRVTIDVLCDRARRMLDRWQDERHTAQETCGGVAGCTGCADWAPAAVPRPQFRVLIVAPKSVCHGWVDQFTEWATLDVNIERLVGSKLQRAERLLVLLEDKTTPVLVAITNYDGVETAIDYLKAVPWDLMVCDESIWIKNPETKRARAAYSVAENVKSRFILTGLPITRNVLDLYGQYHFLKPGCLGYTTYYAFSSYYGDRNWYGSTSDYKKEKLPELQERLAKFSFCIKREQCFDLPAKLYQTIEPEMSGEQAAAYEQMSEKMLVDLEKVGAGGELDTDEDVLHELQLLTRGTQGGDGGFTSLASIVLVRMLRLAQITSGFLTMDDKTVHRFKEQPKLDALEERLEELPDDERVVVCSRFRPEIEEVVRRFAKFGAMPFYGGLSDKVRESTLKRFQKRDGCRILVMNPASGGYGLNELIGTAYFEYLSNSFSFGERAQSEDRGTRLGITRSVLYTDYVIGNTVDQLVLDKIKQKRELSELLTDKQAVINALRSQLAARQLAK